MSDETHARPAEAFEDSAVRNPAGQRTFAFAQIIAQKRIKHMPLQHD